MINYDLKSLNSFFQLVDPKIEPIVQSGWVSKVNTKGNLDKRYFVATRSALYLCKNIFLLKKLTISRVCAWVDLNSFVIIDSKTFSFSFCHLSITMIKNEAIRFIAPVLSTIRSLLPPQHHFRYQILSGMQNLSSNPSITQFIDLYLSCCHSSNIIPDFNFCLNIRKSLKKGLPLEIIQNNYSDQVINVLSRSLSLTRTIKKLIIGGFDFPELYSSISQILIDNKTIKELSIIDHDRTNGFFNFLSTLKTSSIIKISFIQVSMKIQMLSSLIDIIPTSNLFHLGFQLCNFSNEYFETFIFKKELIKNIKSIEFSNDKLQNYQLLNVFEFNFLTIINFSFLTIDISDFFDQLNNKFPNLIEIDLSGNYCSEKLKENYNLSKNLINLNLSSIKWFSNTLELFLNKQIFNQLINLNLSNLILDNNKFNFNLIFKNNYLNFLKELNCSGNRISKNFLNYLLKFSTLKTLIINNCIFNENKKDILIKSFSEFLSNSFLIKISIEKTFQNFGLQFISNIKNILINHLTLKELNISNNYIGDDGIFILKEIILKNNSIVNFNFDGINPSSLPNYLQFLHDIVSSPHLYYVFKPIQDIELLSNQNLKKNFKELKSFWIRLKKQCFQRAHEFSYTFNNDFLNQFENISSDFENISQKIINVSWDIDFEIEEIDFQNKWDILEKKYSLEKLSNVFNI